ncbi:hypothetical protein ACJIZ3_012898 [Penstemon smallii]|uniref:Knottins-like domain-containing protein n=1 Tax=Penstemon smallii TaxID=265156 RepID=A0ABD3UND9_9LAMI
MNAKNLFGVVLLLLLSLSSREGIMDMVMARSCEAASATFRGPCLVDRDCQIICMNEGFSDGDCQGFLRRCFCKKPCT